MAREQLTEAVELLEEAAEAAAGDAAETIRSQIEHLRALVERDSEPDHGRLDRHQQRLNGLRADVDERVTELIDEANELISEYRSKLEGV